MSGDLGHLSTPSVLVDLDIAERNVQRAVKALGAQGIAHRPHIKAHKSVYFAKMQQEYGCRGITCAKLGEAEAMAGGGIDDILIAFPLIGADKLARYRALIEKGVRMRTIVNSIPGAKGLSELGVAMGMRLEVLVELDGGIARGGLLPGTPLREFGENIRDLPGIEVVGVECYSGGIYSCRTMDEVRLRAQQERDEILSAAEILRGLGYAPRILSGGSSFSVDCPEALRGITEVRAGNYIFNDNARLAFGLIGLEDCALRILCTVVSRPDARSLIIDAGCKTLTSDLAVGREGYGLIVEAPDVIIYKLNEEHGYVRSEKPLDFAIGDTVQVIPNHACVISNLNEALYGMRGGKLERVIAAEGRGKNR